MGSESRLRRALHRLTAGEDELLDEELRSRTVEVGASRVSDCRIGEPVTVAGTLRAVVLRPLAGVPTLEAELYDGTGTITLVWLGRRRIRGVEPGRALVAHGRLTRREGMPTVFNPSYELQVSGE